jgi:hypothetical protein
LNQISDNFKVIIVITPHFEKALKPITDNDFKWFYQRLDRLSNETKIGYYDYSRDSRLQDIIYFSDTIHLNESGGILFTDIIIQDLIDNALITVE